MSVTLPSQVVDSVCFRRDGLIHEQGSPAQVLGDRGEQPTRRFLSRFHA